MLEAGLDLESGQQEAFRQVSPKFSIEEMSDEDWNDRFTKNGANFWGKSVMPQRVITSFPEAILPHPSLLYLLIISQVNRNVELRLGRIIIWLKSEDAKQPNCQS